MHCTIDRELKLWYFVPHMHRWGKHITVDVTQGSAKTSAVRPDNWDESFTFHPPELRKDPAIRSC